MTRNFVEKWLTGSVFLVVAKAFDIVWVDGLLFKLTALNFYFLIKICLPTCITELSKRPSRRPSTCRGMRAGVAQGGLVSSVLFSLWKRHAFASRHFEQALYAEDTAMNARRASRRSC